MDSIDFLSIRKIYKDAFGTFRFSLFMTVLQALPQPVGNFVDRKDRQP